MVNLLIPEQDLQRQINAQEQEHHSEIAKLRQEKEVKFRETGVLIKEKRQSRSYEINRQYIKMLSNCSNEGYFVEIYENTKPDADFLFETIICVKPFL